MIEIEKAENGYIIYVSEFREGIRHPIRTLKHVFANLEQALRFIRKEFGEDDENK